MEVREKRHRGVKKEAQGGQVSPLTPLSVAPGLAPNMMPLTSDGTICCATTAIAT